MTKNLLCLLLVTLLACSCSNTYYYKKGLKNAANPTPAAVYDNLTRITPDNKDLVRDTINGQPYILVVTWKASASFYINKDSLDTKTNLYRYNTANWMIWVTAAPYLREKHYGHLSDKKLIMRLNQALGLPPTSQYGYFVEMWVRPQDFFRPCYDNSITTNVCELAPTKKDSTNPGNLAWLSNYIEGSFNNPDVMKNYPFTHLGYTYDWCPRNKSHEGLSEFVVDKNKKVYIKKVYTTREYFQ